MREIYLAPFQAPFRLVARVGDVRQQRGQRTYACQNDQLLRAILDKGWGFNGVVGSELRATHDAVASIVPGSTSHSRWPTGRVLQPTGHTRDRRQGSRQARHDATTRSSASCSASACSTTCPRRHGQCAGDGAFARAAAEEGTVLLKNSGDALPLNPTNIKSIAVIGLTQRRHTRAAEAARSSSLLHS